jgi:hypothetical protein
MGAIDLVALHQADMDKVRCHALDGLDDIDEHGQIGLDQLGTGRTVLIGSVENVSHVREIGEFVDAICRVEQIDGYVPDLVRRGAAAAGKTDDRPVFQCFEITGEIAADDALSADDEGGFVLVHDSLQMCRCMRYGRAADLRTRQR